MIAFPPLSRGRCVAAGALLFSGLALHAQANIPQLRGDVGILAGTLPQPGGTAGLLYSSYNPTNTIVEHQTALSGLQPHIGTATLQLGYTFPSAILGGHWAVAANVPWANFAIPTPDIHGPTSWGFGDLYVQPARLGWTFPSADVVAGFGMYAPTGRFHAGATSNTGLGMWSYETSAGSTVYLGPSKQSSFAALLSYQTQSRVRGTDQKAGDVLTLEGGVAHTILPHAGQLGLAYYGMWKVSGDQNFVMPSEFAGRNRMYGVGPEITVPVSLSSARGAVTLRYLEEFDCRYATQGNSLYLSFTAHLPPGLK